MSPLISSALRLPVGIAGYIQAMSNLSISYSLVQKRQKSLISIHTYQNQKKHQRKKQAQVLTYEIPLSISLFSQSQLTALYWSQLRAKVTTFTQGISYYSTIITYLLTIQTSSTTIAYYYLLLTNTILLLYYSLYSIFDAQIGLSQ